MKIERDFINEDIRLRDESIFNCASGTLGVRGCFEEGCPDNSITIRGAYINGFCDSEEIRYNEKLHGFPEVKHTIVNLPDAQSIECFVEGKKIVCFDQNVKDYKYVLDMENGLVKREFIYNTGKGEIKFNFERLASFNRPGLFIIKVVIKSISYNGEIKIKSSLNGDVKNFTLSSDPRVASGSGKMLKVNFAENISPKDSEMLQQVQVETLNSHRKMNVTVGTIIDKTTDDKDKFPLSYEKEGALLSASNIIDLTAGEEILVNKFAYYHEPIDGKDGLSELLDAYNAGYETLRNEQISYMQEFWKSSRVLVDCDDIKQETIDFSIYEMLCSAGRDGLTSVAAKGLSGEGYEGHYFWDCETYIFPFFLTSKPDIAKQLLKYRYSKLEQAREHARELGHNKGALFPWRTIMGNECSSYFPSGSAQYHINGDIARAFEQYWNSTKDESFLSEICEVLLETARLWLDVGHYNNDRFEIDCVTGPDEYTCMVNNNYYTNAGAANNLYYAYKLINILKNTDKYAEFVKKTKVSDEELVEFKKAHDKMYYPYDEKLGIIKQDDSFLDKAKIDLTTIPKENFPLLLHYHPMWLIRHQVLKQADAVLADYLFGGLDCSTSMKTFKYYEPITTHDSSLSKCIYGIVAAKLGDLNKAKEYFLQTLGTDLNDHQGNTRDGLHLANLGGCYCMITGGFAGLRINEEGIHLFPMLPEGINSYSFPLIFEGQQINITVDKNGTKISKVSKGNPLKIKVYDETVELNNDEVVIKRKAKAVIFDLDGVITDTAIYHYQAWKKIADELKVEFDEKRNESFKGVSRKTCLELLLSWGNIKVSEEQFNELLERKNNYYKELLQQLTPNSILPGVSDCIKSLHEKGIKVALFSVSKNTDAILERLGVRDYFDVIVSGKDIVNSKPNFEGYLLAADRMKIDSRLCVMVEDSIAGIEGAKALSMKTLAIMKDNTPNADICIDTTAKLNEINNFF